MIKYYDYSVVFEEIPEKVTLAFSISNCQNNCKGCHSSFLREDVGDELTMDVISNQYDYLLKRCNCLLFMGEGNDLPSLVKLAKDIKEEYGVEVALYSGRVKVENELFEVFDYVKVGPYIESLGPLNASTTNQRLYYHGNDITYKFLK